MINISYSRSIGGQVKSTTGCILLMIYCRCNNTTQFNFLFCSLNPTCRRTGDILSSDL